MIIFIVPLARTRVCYYAPSYVSFFSRYLTDDDLVTLLEGVVRNLKVKWCGSLADTARDIVMGSVAGAVPSAVVTSLTNWDTSQVSADT